jgi:predicted amidophosphoribosyltransferase
LVDELRCEECGKLFQPKSRRQRFCRDACRYRARDARDYAASLELERAKSRAYYAANREQVIARVIAQRKAD